jgi:hypothetical protein
MEYTSTYRSAFALHFFVLHLLMNVCPLFWNWANLTLPATGGGSACEANMAGIYPIGYTVSAKYTIPRFSKACMSRLICPNLYFGENDLDGVSQLRLRIAAVDSAMPLQKITISYLAFSVLESGADTLKR